MKKRMNKIISLITKNKRKVVLLTIIFLIVFTSAFIYINLTNPTKINSMIASVVNKGAPANKAFDDDVFYKVVVDAYNKKNNTSLPYTTSLTDEQLKTITSIYYSGYNREDAEKIKSAKGIEKLTSLTSLDLKFNNLSSIDLSENISLTNLNLRYNDLNSIDLSHNTALTDLVLDGNGISSIDLSKNTSLTSLFFEDNSLNSIDVSANTSLTSLDLSKNNLNSIDVSKNTSLTSLELGYNHLSSIDLSKNTALTSLDLPSTKLSSIDLSKNTALTSLDLSHNNLNSIDLSKNTALTILYCNENKLSSIDLSQNTSLTNLILRDNPLVFEKQRLLKGKTISGNLLSNIKLPEGSDKFYITYEIEDDTVASFSDNKVTGLKIGNTNLVATLNGIREDSSSSTSGNIKLNGSILVYDLTSTKYNINHDKKYIYIGADSINSVLNNIKLENISGKIEDNNLVLYDGDVKVDEYRLVGISSSTYDLSKDYIYIGINTFDKSKITCTNCTLEESGNTLNIKYGSTILKSYKLVSISSNKYDLSKDNIRLNKDEVFDINSISVINGTKEYSNNKLYIKYNSDILKTYNITYRLKGDVNGDGKITNADVSKLFAYYKGKTKLTEEDLSVSDLNGDGKITNADVSKLFAYYKGKIKEL